jgi:hypothetical protein
VKRAREPVRRPSPRSATRAAGCVTALACLGLTGCGAGVPLLHPAQVLPKGEVRAAAGLSSDFALAGFGDATRDALHDAANNPNVPGPSGTDPTYSKGAVVAAAVGAGVAPFAAARVGVGGGAEGGLAYTGRGIRADLRKAFDLSEHWALSVGAGGSAALYAHQEEGALQGVDLSSLHGWGADLPLLVGYESEGGLYMLWVGARAGWEQVNIDAPASATPLGMPPLSLSASHLWAGPLIGMAVGFRHLHVALELDTSYGSVSGDFNGSHVQVSGATVGPSSALWWRF